ncbi:hypothetical protein SAMN05216431_10653 [Ligilactobacillus sp. WC1T17]|uniref:Uncharacterized protein n=1 Tax=Ligilactobacillus ruminis TaxID=1623 RepID=A0ABY1ABI7_9LACO|nr:hypothetical protein SAMN05216431_10653 [Ligilactobacillus ruminis]
MVFFGLTLYIAWLLLALLNLIRQPQNRKFSYQQAFFGRRLWYLNIRNYLLLIALYLLAIWAPLKLVFLLSILTAVFLFGLSLRNFFKRIANPYADIFLIILSIILFLTAYKFILKV